MEVWQSYHRLPSAQKGSALGLGCFFQFSLRSPVCNPCWLSWLLNWWRRSAFAWWSPAIFLPSLLHISAALPFEIRMPNRNPWVRPSVVSHIHFLEKKLLPSFDILSPIQKPALFKLMPLAFISSGVRHLRSCPGCPNRCLSKAELLLKYSLHPRHWFLWPVSFILNFLHATNHQVVIYQFSK